MASKNNKPISPYNLFKTQVDELKQMNVDLEQLKNELIMAQTKYHQRLSDYEKKVEQLRTQADKIQLEQEEKEINLQNATAEWNDLKVRLRSSFISPNQKVKLNIGGKYFQTTMETLTKNSEGTTSYFKALFSRQWQLEKDPKDDSVFIDRSGDLFNYILQYLRTKQLTFDEDDATLRRNLIIEAEFYKIGGLVNLLKRNGKMPQNGNIEDNKLYSDTKILSSEHEEHLNKLFGIDHQRWKLIYRASRDGFAANIFHKWCDGYGPTMTVIRSVNGFIFGGYTTVPWTSSHLDKGDTNAFLFTLENPHGLKPTKFPIAEQSVRFAVSHRKTSGPTFGSINNGGSDIHLLGPFNDIGNLINFPASYKDTTGKGRKTFTGEPNFASEDVEVFVRI